MGSPTRREFTDEFKGEAVALWETSGCMQTDVARELTQPALDAAALADAAAGRLAAGHGSGTGGRPRPSQAMSTNARAARQHHKRG